MVDESYGFRLLAHDDLRGFGDIGEGMAIQKAPDGRRILWLAHEGPPKNFTGIDVTDPARPRVTVQTDLPHGKVRSNSLDVWGNVLAVAYQTVTHGLSPAGFELFDISQPENPRTIGFFDCSGPHSRGVHQLWFADGAYVHCAGGASDFEPHNLLDDQIYRIIDVRDPSRPVEAGRWWMPGTRVGDIEPPPQRLPIDCGFRAHNTNVYPQRPDRAYVGYLDGGAFILDISDLAEPKVVGAWNPHPPYPGFTHTVLPLFGRDLLLVTDECVQDDGGDWPKLTWVVDARCEKNLVPISTLPLPPVENFAPRGGRYGSHNLHENQPAETSFRSDRLVVGAFFSGGIRAYDLSNPLQPREVAAFVPPTPEESPVRSSQMNDVYVDENGIVYAGERHKGGLYVLEMDV
jgi:hypothetical protein